jgi:DNA-binding IclR family transcriptional regulator
MRIDPVRPEYDATVGAMARLHEGSATQASDPAKVAELVLRVAAMDEPPLRLLVGEDAFTYGTAAGRALLAADERWAALSRSTTADDATAADLDPLGASH